jgi:hypothetical protein
MRSTPIHSSPFGKLFALLLAAVVADAAEGPRADRFSDLLAQYEMDEAFFEQFENGDPLSDNELELVARLLYRMKQTPKGELDRWSATEEAEEAPRERSRGDLLPLRGRIIAIKELPLSADLTERFGVDRLLQSTLGTEDGQTFALISPHVPRSWRRGDDLDYPAAASAVLIKPSIASDRELPLMLTAHIAWHPPTLLGRLGMDVGLFDDVVDRQPIRAAERECFYQLLAVVNRAEPNQIERAATALVASARESLPRRIDQEIDAKRQALLRHALEQANHGVSDVIPLFNSPETQHGELKLLEGIARRAVEIRVEDPEIVKQFGLQRYFEVELFTDDSQNNPITVCAAEIGPELTPGDRLSERVRCAGFFLKTWSYPLGKTEREGARLAKNQLAPLLVARRVDWVENAKPASLLGGAIPLVLVGLLSLAALFVITRIARSGRWTRARGATDTRFDDAGLRSALAELEATRREPAES